MPFFYDIVRQATTNGSANTESAHIWGHTIANQETTGIYGWYAAARSLTAGGGQLRVKHNTGTATTGGTGTTPNPKNLRGSVAAQSVWATDASAITLGGTYVNRMTIGFAQTGGTGGYVPPLQQAAIQMMPNTTNPVDIQFYSIAAGTGIAFDLTLDIGEGI